MGTFLDDLTLPHHNDLVSIDDRAQPVGDHDNSLLLFFKKLVEGLLDLELALGVQSTGRLVEEQDARLADQGTCNRDSLLLATRKGRTALTDNRVHPIGKELLIVKEAATCLPKGELDAFFNLRLRQTSLIKAIDDVVPDGDREEAGLLLDDGKLGLMVPLSVDLLDIMVVEEHFPSKWVVEALHQSDDRGFSTAGVTDECDSLAILHIDVDSLEHGDVWL